MSKTVALLLSLSDAKRLSALALLWGGEEKCVCEIMELVRISQPAASRMMGVLKRLGLVTARRDAQWVRYRKNQACGKAVERLVENALALYKQEKRSEK